MKYKEQWQEGYSGAPQPELDNNDKVDRLGYIDETKRIASMIRAGQIQELLRGKYTGADISNWEGNHYKDKIELIDYQRYVLKKLAQGVSPQKLIQDLQIDTNAELVDKVVEDQKPNPEPK